MKSVINFSIIIPCHNSSGFIEPLLKSIPNRPDLEVILVDDYSSPGELKATKDVFKSFLYGKSQFHVNTGINSAGVARNIGIEKATGKWLIFSDSDDRFTDNLDDTLNKYSSSLSDIIFFRPASDSKKGNYLTSLYNNYTDKKISEKFLAYSHRSPWSKMIKRRLVEDYKIRYESSKNANDILFGAKIAFFAQHITVASSETIYFYAERTGALTDYRDTKKYDIKVNELIKRNVWLKKNLSAEDFLQYRDSVIAPCVGSIRRYGLRYTIDIYKKMRQNYFSGLLTRELYDIVMSKVVLKK